MTTPTTDSASSDVNPTRLRCSFCDGTGSIVSDGDCARCAGTGLPTRVDKWRHERELQRRNAAAEVAVFPAAEALKRLRLLSAHQLRHQEFDFAHGGDDPDDHRLAVEVGVCGYARDVYGDAPVMDWSIGLQGSRDLDVELCGMTRDEVCDILAALRAS